jgi:hypothetical protein
MTPEMMVTRVRDIENELWKRGLLTAHMDVFLMCCKLRALDMGGGRP